MRTDVVKFDMFALTVVLFNLICKSAVVDEN